MDHEPDLWVPAVIDRACLWGLGEGPEPAGSRLSAFTLPSGDLEDWPEDCLHLACTQRAWLG